jgi:hypothetical protein
MSWKREGKEEGRKKQEVGDREGGGGGRKKKLTVKVKGCEGKKKKNPEPCPGVGLGFILSKKKKPQNRIFWMVHWWVLGRSSPPWAYWTANSDLNKTVIPHHSSWKIYQFQASHLLKHYDNDPFHSFGRSVECSTQLEYFPKWSCIVKKQRLQDPGLGQELQMVNST